MKILILYFVSGLMCTTSMGAQDQYEEKMNQAFALWNNEKPTEASQLFEQIGRSQGKWLPYYYAAQVKIEQALPMENPTQKKELLGAAQQLLEKATSLTEKEAELLVLQAMLHTGTLLIDPETYGMTLSPVINRLYAQALDLAPNNPRVILSKARWDMGYAEFFGEDPTAFCPDVERSLALFAAENHSPLTAPAWGEERAIALLKKPCGTE